MVVFNKTYNLPNGESQRAYFGIIVKLPQGCELYNATIQMDLKRKGSNIKIKTFDLTNGFTIIDPLTFKFSTGKLDAPEGEYEFDILISYPDYDISWISGEWIINETITRKK